MTVDIGIDWSRKKHDVVITDAKGKRVSAGTMPHSREGFAQLGVSHQECRVGLETAYTLRIDYLWQVGYEQVYVIQPNIVNKSRGRYRQSGAYDDQRDAYVISDLLRTDGHRFLPWHPGSVRLQQLRSTVSFGQFLTKQSVSQANRLDAVLSRYYPAARAVFSWPSPIACHFLLAYPTPQTSRTLSYDAFCGFAKQHGHRQPATWFNAYERLQANYPQAAPAIITAYQTQATPLAQMLLQTLTQKSATLAQLQTRFEQHENASLFASLPGAGQLLAPALLVKFGEDLVRFPTAATVQMLAGTAPITQRSGKVNHVAFRRTCDKDFRSFAQQFAWTSLAQSPWAKAYFQAAAQRRHSFNPALRCLANRWLAIIWKMWHDHKPYDEAFHLQQRLARRRA